MIIDQIKSGILPAMTKRNILFAVGMILMVLWLVLYTIIVQDIVKIIYS